MIEFFSNWLEICVKYFNNLSPFMKMFTIIISFAVSVLVVLKGILKFFFKFFPSEAKYLKKKKKLTKKIKKLYGKVYGKTYRMLYTPALNNEVLAKQGAENQAKLAVRELEAKKEEIENKLALYKE